MGKHHISQIFYLVNDTTVLNYTNSMFFQSHRFVPYLGGKEFAL